MLYMIGRELAHENEGRKKNSHRGKSAIETSGPNENVESKKKIYVVSSSMTAQIPAAAPKHDRLSRFTVGG